MDFPHALTAAISICAPSVLPAKIGTSFRCPTNCPISMDIDTHVGVTYAAPRSIDARLLNKEVFSDAINAIMMFASSV